MNHLLIATANRVLKPTVTALEMLFFVIVGYNTWELIEATNPTPARHAY